MSKSKERRHPFLSTICAYTFYTAWTLNRVCAIKLIDLAKTETRSRRLQIDQVWNFYCHLIRNRNGRQVHLARCLSPDELLCKLEA